MRDIIVIGPINRLYYLGYWDEKTQTFSAINSFENKGLAEASAYRMIQFRINELPPL